MMIPMEWLMWLIPIILLQVTLQIVATVSLVNAEAVKWNNKILWGVIIWCFGLIGPILFLVIGRDE